MSFSHKAYSLNWTAFEATLAPLLEQALRNNTPELLFAFVDQHRSDCTDPYEGEPLSDTWQTTLGPRDVQEAADYALTYCYDPADDFGLAEEWGDLDETLPPVARTALLGTAFGPPEAPFDPGRMGSYFQSPSQARDSLTTLEEHSHMIPESFLESMRSVVANGYGIYITF